ncbi:MAG TPA: hypothetical protein VN747_09965, partial [Burkholderiales bacterium]|nr:hypothetical protein [Burkholderiales bacterium]
MTPAQSADPRRVLADRVEQLYSQLPLAIIATVLVSVVAIYELRGSRIAQFEWNLLIWFWSGVVALLTVARIALYWGYR